MQRHGTLASHSRQEPHHSPLSSSPPSGCRWPSIHGRLHILKSKLNLDNKFLFSRELSIRKQIRQTPWNTMFSSPIKEPHTACQSTRVHRSSFSSIRCCPTHHEFDGVPSYHDERECAELFRGCTHRSGRRNASMQERVTVGRHKQNLPRDGPRPMIVYFIGTNNRATSLA